VHGNRGRICNHAMPRPISYRYQGTCTNARYVIGFLDACTRKYPPSRVRRPVRGLLVASLPPPPRFWRPILEPFRRSPGGSWLVLVDQLPSPNEMTPRLISVLCTWCMQYQQVQSVQVSLMSLMEGANGYTYTHIPRKYASLVPPKGDTVSACFRQLIRQ
jgi:hypothetical protein